MEHDREKIVIHHVAPRDPLLGRPDPQGNLCALMGIVKYVMIGRTVVTALAVAAFSLGGCATVAEPVHRVVSRNDACEIR
jgi:hypothetical protein